jgi:hypothetical protein
MRKLFEIFNPNMIILVSFFNLIQKTFESSAPYVLKSSTLMSSFSFFFQIYSKTCLNLQIQVSSSLKTKEKIINHSKQKRKAFEVFNPIVVISEKKY